jgi:hypothetical protein
MLEVTGKISDSQSSWSTSRSRLNNAAAEVIGSNPDGYTLFSFSRLGDVDPTTKVKYDPLGSFEPLVSTGPSPMRFVSARRMETLES